jgi:hypothetical protein
MTITKADVKKAVGWFLTVILVHMIYSFLFMLAWNLSIAAMGIVPVMEYVHALWFVVGIVVGIGVFQAKVVNK